MLGQFADYSDVPGVAADSRQNTFVAARLWIDNARWRGVPFYLRTGKRLAKTAQRVSLILRKPVNGPLADQLPADTNVLSFSLAGDGEITLPIAILQYLQWKIDPTVAAISTLQIVLVTVILLATDRFVSLAKVAT